MAKRKKNSPKLNPTLTTIIILGLLLMGALGIQIPEILQDYFGIETPKIVEKSTQQKTTSSETGDNPGPIEHGLATFTQEELRDSTKGWITYGKLDGLERPTEANALIKKNMINTGTKANANVRPPGFISGLEPHGHSRGHLIGRQFGGSGDDPKNLVTIYQTPVNSPMMTKYENQIRQAVDTGETVRYRVIPVYNDSDLMPKEIHMEAQSIAKEGTINFNVSIVNLK